MKRIIVTIAALVLLVLSGSPANAAGSDSPTPYTVDTAGVTLPAGATFPASGHVNIKYLSNGQTKSVGIHMDPNNNQPGGKWIGRSFIPWSAFAGDIDCITWVQVAGYNTHFGEGGQAPICLTKPPTEPPTDSETREKKVPNCEERIVSWTTEKRDAIFDYDWTKPGWVRTGWTEWKKTGSGIRNEKDPSCGEIPMIGSSTSVALAGAGLLVLLGGTGLVIVARRRNA